MLSQSRFHELDVKGAASLTDGFYLSADTAKMAELSLLTFDFGSKRRIRNTVTGALSKPLLQARIALDTATVLIDGVGITVADFALSAGVLNTAPVTDTTLIVPVGGGLKIGRLNVESVTDSAGARMTGLDGRVMLRRFNGLDRVPEIVLNIDLRRLAAGTLSSRLLLSKAHVNARMHKLPRLVKMQQEIRRLTDSIGRARPDLSPDSVLRPACRATAA